MDPAFNPTPKQRKVLHELSKGRVSLDELHRLFLIDSSRQHKAVPSIESLSTDVNLLLEEGFILIDEDNHQHYNLVRPETLWGSWMPEHYRLRYAQIIIQRKKKIEKAEEIAGEFDEERGKPRFWGMRSEERIIFTVGKYNRNLKSLPEGEVSYDGQKEGKIYKGNYKFRSRGGETIQGTFSVANHINDLS